jgi:hypothetical protein
MAGLATGCGTGVKHALPDQRLNQVSSELGACILYGYQPIREPGQLVYIDGPGKTN